jgi:hypothetical protein
VKIFASSSGGTEVIEGGIRRLRGWFWQAAELCSAGQPRAGVPTWFEEGGGFGDPAATSRTRQGESDSATNSRSIPVYNLLFVQ